MKKAINLILLIMSIAILNSCIISHKQISRIDEVLYGKWLIDTGSINLNGNNNTITFDNPRIFINDTIEGEMEVLPMNSHYNKWIWDDFPEDKHMIKYDIKNISDTMEFVGYENTIDIVYIKNIPFFKDKIMRLIRIK